MDHLDDLLRDTLRSQGDGVFDVTGLAAAARSGHARRTARRRQLTAVGTAGVLAVGGSSALALARHGSRSPAGSTAVSAHPTPGTSTAGSLASSAPAATHTSDAPAGLGTGTPLPAAGSRLWSSHGLQVRVPAAWPANHTDCGTASANTVILDQGAVPACGLTNPPAVDAVEYGTATFYDVYPAPALHAATLDGHAAKIGTQGLADGRTATTLVVPDLDVSIVVKSKDAGLVADIVASAAIVDADADGCASQVAVVEPAGPPTRAGATHTMVPGTPVAAVVCHYESPQPADLPFSGDHVFLASGTQVPANQLSKMTGILNTLKPGLATWQGLAGYCTPAAHDGYLIRFTYSSGAPVDVYLHTLNCDHMGFDNGAVTGYISSAFGNNAQYFIPNHGFTAAGEAIK